ncbi:CLL_collapsed_G0027250.mRNA.1.CDS.1 [Saccharomyces cerevisiae]|nr:CLL_HP2_G0023420.mRNA.1.CDS.1 [Saccharomyces cerevisiae]CAI6446558.1 CLL_HP2_G0023420.mRNA.1.CDS.1 [Saccharomyces cerevisiae]CAI6460476.1 CLL_HP1_G0026960.mRNA.1.CDS.1 [Saccharomyces cerevisiae]CAI7242048.1 CLL_collapsed_G0027250.mRNA.1.CDS.1 [Saccharomyces cerevisiae]
MLLFQYFSYTQRENRQIGGKTWSLISSLFHLNETLASALYHPYETLALYEAYFALREKKFPL